MSVKIMAQVWEHSQARLGELLVLLAIADFADDKGIAYPTMDVLSRKTRLSERETRYVVRALIEIGELRVDYRPSRANRFCVLVQSALFTQSTEGGKDCPLPDSRGARIAPSPQSQVEENPSDSQLARGQSLPGGQFTTISPPPSPLVSPHTPLFSSIPKSQSRHKKDPPVMPPKKGGRAYSEAHWTEFQKSYPHRLGKALDLKTTKQHFVRLSLSDQALLASAARNYREALTLQGLKAKDARRFLRTRNGQEPWRDWIEPAPGALLRCTWTVNLKGKRCEAPVDTQQTTTSYKLCPKHLTIRLDLDRKIAEAMSPGTAGPSTGAIMPVSKAAKLG